MKNGIQDDNMNTGRSIFYFDAIGMRDDRLKSTWLVCFRISSPSRSHVPLRCPEVQGTSALQGRTRPPITHSRAIGSIRVLVCRTDGLPDSLQSKSIR